MDFDHLGRPQGLWAQQLAADYPLGKRRQLIVGNERTSKMSGSLVHATPVLAVHKNPYFGPVKPAMLSHADEQGAANEYFSGLPSRASGWSVLGL
jgi:hypothetical protein